MFLKEEERNTYGVYIGFLLFITVPALILGILGYGFVEYIVAVIIIFIIGLIFFGYDAFLK